MGGAEVFYEITMPPPDLVIFGAGHDAAPVAQLAWTLGFAVTVVDVREAFLAPERFRQARRWCARISASSPSAWRSRAGSFVLVMNHHVERDQESLRFSLESDAAYIGVLGPRSRYDKLLAGLAAQGYVPDADESRPRAKPGGAFAWRRNAGRSGGVDPGGDPGDSTRVRRRVSQRLGRQPSPPRRQAALGQLVVLRRVDIHQQIRRKLQDHGPLAVPVQDGTSAVLELGELGEELPLEQMRRRHDLAVPDADDGRRVLAVGLEHRPVLVRRHERLIGERKHGGVAVGEMLDRRAERTAHSAGELHVDRVSEGQTFERCQRGLVLAAQHDQDIVEARGADLSDRSANERLAAKWQEELLAPHSC